MAALSFLSKGVDVGSWDGVGVNACDGFEFPEDLGLDMNTYSGDKWGVVVNKRLESNEFLILYLYVLLLLSIFLPTPI